MSMVFFLYVCICISLSIFPNSYSLHFSCYKFDCSKDGLDGEVYYFNQDTGQSSWDHPCDEKYRQVYFSLFFCPGMPFSICPSVRPASLSPCFFCLLSVFLVVFLSLFHFVVMFVLPLFFLMVNMMYLSILPIY